MIKIAVQDVALYVAEMVKRLLLHKVLGKNSKSAV